MRKITGAPSQWFLTATFPHGLGPNRKSSLRAYVVRCSPNIGLKSDIAPCPFGANKRLMHRSNNQRYSITSSARSSNAAGISSPSAFAVFTLMASWNLVG